MSHVYIAPYVGVGTDADEFRPRGSEQPGWSAIDLRGNPTASIGRAIMSVSVRDDTIGTYLGDVPDAISPTVKQMVESHFSLTLDGTRLRDILPELLLLHAREDGTRWRPLRAARDGVFRVYLDGLFWERRPIRGGTVITESFDKADSTVLGPDLVWTEAKDLEVISLKCSMPTVVSLGFAHAGTLATDNHYSQGVVTLVSSGVATDNFVGVAARGSGTDAGSETHYHWQYRMGSGGNAMRLRKTINGVITQLTTAVGTVAAGDTIRIEVNGSLLEGFKNSVSQATATDTSITGSLRAGVYLQLGSTGATKPTLDIWEAGDLGGAPAAFRGLLLLGAGS